MRIVVDSYAWIEIFKGSAEGKSAVEILAQAMEVYTPSTVMAEVARKYIREGLSQNVTKDRLRRITEASQVASIDGETACLSASGDEELRRHARSRGLTVPSLFDGIVLGTARYLGCKVLTGDEHFAGLPETVLLGSKD